MTSTSASVSTPKKILVTGAGGLLGFALAKSLKERGHQVFHFSRTNYPSLEKLGVGQRKGDIRESHLVNQAVKGMDAVFHAAAKVDMWGAWEDFRQINVEGTKNILCACQRYGVSRLVYSSSPSVVFGKVALEWADEKTPYPHFHLGHYARSKAMAEKLVLAANDGKKFCTVALRPHLIWGPGDKNMLPRLVQRAREGKLKIVGQGKNLVDVTYVDNAATAHLQAWENLNPGSAVCGKSYFIGQERPVVLWDFINQILQVHGLSPIRKKVPAWAAYTVGGLLEWGYEVRKKHDTWPAMTRFVALQLSKSHYFNHHNAERDFGYHPQVTIEEGLQKLKNQLELPMSASEITQSPVRT